MIEEVSIGLVHPSIDDIHLVRLAIEAGLLGTEVTSVIVRVVNNNCPFWFTFRNDSSAGFSHEVVLEKLIMTALELTNI